MSASPSPIDRRRNWIVLAAIAVILLPVILSVVGRVFALGPTVPEPFLEPPDTTEKTCVRGKTRDWMRFQHMNLLKEIRNDAVRDGRRDPEVSFDKCTDCHKSRKHFCDRCHDQVNLTPDCFDCHWYPEYAEDAEPPVDVED